VIFNNKPSTIQLHSERVFGLDIYRAIAIILVVIGHGGFMLNDTVLNDFPYVPLIDGVDIFFVLSGFLIGSILLKEINQDHPFGIKQLVTFWKRRWLRTLPNYYLILLVNYIIIHQGIINENIEQFNWKFLFFLQNFNSSFYGFFWESWSLSVEEWFYIISPLLLLILLLFITPKKSFIIVTLLMLLCPLIYRMYMSNPLVDAFEYDITFKKIVLFRLDSIAFGLLAAWCFFYYETYWLKFKVFSLVIGIGLMVYILKFAPGQHFFYQQVIYFTISPLSAMLLLPFANSIKHAKGSIAKAVTHISKISYSMYLLNLAIVAEVIRDNFSPKGGFDGILKYIIYWFIVILGASLLHRYFEKPFMNLRDRKLQISSSLKK
jgi:peptidoglycan/LPS O-acetylase OafA/YrhL